MLTKTRKNHPDSAQIKKRSTPAKLYRGGGRKQPRPRQVSRVTSLGSKSTKCWMKITTPWQLKARFNPCSLPKETLPKSFLRKFQSGQRPDSRKSKIDSTSIVLIQSASIPKGSRANTLQEWPDRGSTTSNKRTTLPSNISSCNVRNTKASRTSHTGSTSPLRCKC